MILVVGGSGMLGTILCRRLRRTGAAVRVLTRDPARAAHLVADGVETVTGDLRDRASLRRALAGATTVVAAAHGFGDDDSVTPASIDRQGNMNLIDAASVAGAAVVLMSVVGASENHPLEIVRAKYAAEQHLVASTTPWTIVRATAFVETWARIMGGSLRSGGPAMVFGRGRNPLNFVSVVDVAALLERVTFDSALRGETIEIGGPANLTFNEFAALLVANAGREGRTATRHVPRTILRLMSTLMPPFKPSLARHSGGAVIMDTVPMMFGAGDARTRFPDLASTTVESALAADQAGLTPSPRDS